MTGIMMTMMNTNSSSTYPNNNVWTGTTTGLQLNLLNAPNSGTTWRDASGNGNNGTVRTAGTGSATYSSGSNGGLTLASGGSTNAAMVSTAYNMANNSTIEVVANITSTSFPAYIFGNENQSTSAGWWAYFFSSTVFKVGSTTRENIFLLTANTGSTRQFTFVFNSGSPPSIDFYINGSLQFPNSTSYGLAPSAATTGLNFNSNHPSAGTSNTPNDTGTGTFYQMRAYNTALNQSQVTANYDAIKTTYGI